VGSAGARRPIWPLAQLICDLGRAMIDHPAWREVDLNPVIAGPQGATAVDALVVVEAPTATHPAS
jgi:hypothetical protein